MEDLDESLNFYEAVLGCERIPRPDGLPGPRGAWMKTGETQVHLTETPAAPEIGTSPSRIIPIASHVAFHVDDLDAAEASLRERGIAYERGQFGLEQIFVQDPSGSLLELTPY